MTDVPEINAPTRSKLGEGTIEDLPDLLERHGKVKDAYWRDGIEAIVGERPDGKGGVERIVLLVDRTTGEVEMLQWEFDFDA